MVGIAGTERRGCFPSVLTIGLSFGGAILEADDSEWALLRPPKRGLPDGCTTIASDICLLQKSKRL